MIIWIGFLICTAVIIYCGSRLSKYGDIIAEKLRLGRIWIGVVLLASATSLPELVNGLTSVTVADTPDIAIGDVLGSCVFNLFLLALMDAFHRGTPMSSKAHQGNILSAAFGIMLIGMVGVNIAAGKSAPSIGWIGMNSLLIFILYPIAMRLVFYFEKRRLAEIVHEIASENKYKDIGLKEAYLKYGINALIVIIAAVFLPYIGKAIAESMGIGETFVGNVFIALSTSLPELAVSISAIRIGAVDLAIGNVFGSNIFNIFILAIDDLFYTKGPILMHLEPGHIFSVFSAIIMTSAAILGLIYRQERKRLFLAWDSLAIAAMFLINILLLYSFS